MRAERCADYGRLVRFAISAQRRDEAASLRTGNHQRKVEASDEQERRPHSLALPPLALSIVGEGEPDALVFPGENGKIGAGRN